MSCSDKIAAWNVLGIQGALASRLLHPVYIDRMIIGEVAPSMHAEVTADCTRALYARLRSINGRSSAALNDNASCLPRCLLQVLPPRTN